MCVRKDSDILFTINMTFGDLATYHGLNSTVLEFNLALGMGMVHTSVHIGNNYDLEDALKLLRF